MFRCIFNRHRLSAHVLSQKAHARVAATPTSKLRNFWLMTCSVTQQFRVFGGAPAIFGVLPRVAMASDIHLVGSKHVFGTVPSAGTRTRRISTHVNEMLMLSSGYCLEMARNLDQYTATPNSAFQVLAFAIASGLVHSRHFPSVNS